MRALTRTQVEPLPAPKFPMLDAGDLPGEEDWALVESFRSSHDFAAESDPDADSLADVMVRRDAFE